MALLSLNAVRKSFGSRLVLDDLDLIVTPARGPDVLLLDERRAGAPA